MCLDISKDETARVRKNLGAGGSVICWKLVRVDDRKRLKLCSLYREAGFKRRWNRSDRPTTRTNGQTVTRGYHVCLTLDRAKASYQAGGVSRLIPVRCRAKDFVAASTKCDHEAVFLSIYIDPADYDKAVQA